MKKSMHDRYEATYDNRLIIDVSVKSVESLYHNFDKSAPYYRKELDQQFVDYLTDCVAEIGSRPFIIRISLEKMPDAKHIDRINNSINNYYIYLREIELRQMKRMFRRSFIMFAIGLVFLISAILATRSLPSHRGVAYEVFAQGLTIAAWISLWESLANIFLEWHPFRENIRQYSRIIESQVIFRPLQ
ncbi:MAG: hypothetical protein WC374_03350 [Phycisphaerae bacterium]|jgi:hypothetical protein